MAYDGTLKFDTSMDSSGFQKDASKLGDIVKGLAVFKILEKGFQAVTNSMDRAISRYDTLNKFPKVLELMGFGADEASTATKKLADGVQGLPTSLDEVVSTAQRLTVLTGNLETATDTTLSLNNAFLASGSSAADASRGLIQYTQMLSSGKVDMVSWRTLQETMGFALQKTAEAFGFAGASAQKDLYAALRDGLITFDQFNAKLVELDQGVGGFAEMAKTSTGGIATAFTNMNTRIAAGVTEVIAGIDRGFSQTRFKSIENIISSTGTAIKNILTSAAGAFEFLASKADILVPALVAVGATVTAWKIGTVLTGIVAGFQTAALQVALYAAQMKTASAADAIHTVALSAKEIIVGLLTGKLTLAAAAQMIWNAAMMANPIGLIIAGVVALTAAIIGLVTWLSSGSAEYKKQKEEVEALTEAQEELTASTKESADAYKSSTAEIEAQSKVQRDLVKELRSVQDSTLGATEKHRKMADTVAQLNASIDGLNIAYDEETGAIRNVNTGQEISLDQLEQLVDAKAELAQANAWTERYNQLIQEQTRIQEELAVIEAKKQEIMENSNLSTREQNKLIKELDEAAAGHAVTMEDVEMRLAVVNDNLAASNTSMAESVVSDYDRMQSAVTEAGENIEDVAAQWNVSVDEILAAMERENISLDEWVTKQEDAWADYEAAVKERTRGVINSFKEIPGEYDKSATEMLEILQNNKLRYAEWESAMEEITRQLGPTAAEEFAKLGPEATSAMQEILGSAELLDEYREVFGVKIDEATGTAVENWNDPNFIGAPSSAIDSSAQMVTQNTALDTAMTGTMEGAKAAAEAVDFSVVGQNIAADIVGGLNSADVNGAMANITAAIQSNTGKVTSAITSMSTSVQTVLRNMKTQATSIATQTMTEINSAIVSRSNTVKASAASMGNGVITSLNTMRTQAANVALQMMTDINSAIVSRTGTVRASATAAANSVVSGLQPMVSGGENVASNMMDGIGAAMDRKASSLYAKAREIANRIAAIMADALDVHSPSRVMIRLFENVMQGIYEGMDGMSGMLYREAESIADGIADRLTISKDVAGALVQQMRTITNSTPLGGAALVPQAAAVGAGGGARYVTSLTQNITTPKPLSASEMTREGQDLLRRQRWQLP